MILFLSDAPLAQLDRALDYESSGQRFESSRARQFYPNNSTSCGGGFLSLKSRLSSGCAEVADFVADEPVVETLEEQPTLFVAPGNHFVFADLTICEKYRWMPR